MHLNELPSRSDQGGKDLLDAVLGILPIAHQTQRRAKQPWAVPLVELGESLFTAGRQRSPQPGFIRWCWGICHTP